MMGVAVAVVAAAAIGAVSADNAASKQKKAASSDRARREKEAAAQKAEADRIARETRPDEEALGETKFGSGDEDGGTGSTQDFLIPKTSVLGESKGRSGLGFKV